MLSQLVVNFMSDAERGVREMARVTRPGGTVASCVWDYSGGMTLLRGFWDAAREVEPERAAAADEGDLMKWSREGELAQLWEAGLTDVRSGAPRRSRVEYADFDDLLVAVPDRRRAGRRVLPRRSTRPARLGSATRCTGGSTSAMGRSS